MNEKLPSLVLLFSLLISAQIEINTEKSYDIVRRNCSITFERMIFPTLDGGETEVNNLFYNIASKPTTLQ
ncbi:hypothetical protein QFZ37_002275 [Chryseobacterium ginsenosidimutans]|uniref:hypothetical protein n=1 Tax=Chryseobacterium ginsenosidimutans TaxID=687846 RepID=UPI00278B3C72|nr:hypothetical protein [Chryseobacterium ginsenosidimutans]MDQ0593906.1 hypothetical protein [Chryseobacterium ginsenosidimutans]